MYESYGRGVEHNGSLSNRRAGCTREPSLTIILCTGDLSPTFNQLRKIQRRWIRPAVMDLRTYTSNYNPTHACNNPTRRQQTGTCHRPRRPRGAIYSCKLSDTYVTYDLATCNFIIPSAGVDLCLGVLHMHLACTRAPRSSMPPKQHAVPGATLSAA